MLFIETSDVKARKTLGQACAVKMRKRSRPAPLFRLAPRRLSR
jgi:hypothetical protein